MNQKEEEKTGEERKKRRDSRREAGKGKRAENWQDLYQGRRVTERGRGGEGGEWKGEGERVGKEQGRD